MNLITMPDIQRLKTPPRGKNLYAEKYKARKSGNKPLEKRYKRKISEKIKQPTWYSANLSLKDKGQWLQNWQNAQRRDAKDKGLKKAFLKHGNKNVFSKIGRDMIAVPGDWGLNDKDIGYLVKPYLKRQEEMKGK